MKLIYTLPEPYIAPETRPPQKESSLPTIHLFQVQFVSFRESKMWRIRKNPKIIKSIGRNTIVFAAKHLLNLCMSSLSQIYSRWPLRTWVFFVDTKYKLEKTWVLDNRLQVARLVCIHIMYNIIICIHIDVFIYIYINYRQTTRIDENHNMYISVYA